MATPEFRVSGLDRLDARETLARSGQPGLGMLRHGLARSPFII